MKTSDAHECVSPVFEGEVETASLFEAPGLPSAEDFDAIEREEKIKWLTLIGF